MKHIPIILLLTGCGYFVKHEGKLVDVFPASAVDDFVDAGTIDTIQVGEVGGSYPRFCEVPDLNNITSGQFGRVVIYATDCCPMNISVSHVFLRRRPNKVFKAVVGSDAVDVRGMIPVRARPHKGFEDGGMHTLVVSVTGFIVEDERKIPIYFSTAYLPGGIFPLSAKAAIASDAPEIGHLVKAFKTRDCFPDFFHAEDLA